MDVDITKTAKSQTFLFQSSERSYSETKNSSRREGNSTVISKKLSVQLAEAIGLTVPSNEPQLILGPGLLPMLALFPNILGHKVQMFQTSYESGSSAC